jgi:hypothetical protein
MRSLFLILSLFIANLITAQESFNINKIDSIVSVISQKAANNEYKVIKGTLLLKGNKTSNIRFHLKGDTTEIIVAESNLKELVTLYYFNNKKLIYVANFTSGNYNEIESSIYLVDNNAYKKESNVFTKVNSELLITQVSAYFDLLQEQLKAN